MISAEQISRELAEIQSRIPKGLKDIVIGEEYAHPTVLKVVQLAIADPLFPPEKKKQLQTLLDAGEFTKRKYVENKKASEMIDKFVAREIKKKVKAGLLPKDAKDLPHVREIVEKVHSLQTKG